MSVTEIAKQLEPQVKRETIELRMKIANYARYNPHNPNHPYSVNYDGQNFISDDTADLVDQVVAWLKKPVKERAKEIASRMEAVNE